MGREEFLEEITCLASKILQKEVRQDTKLLEDGGYVDSVNIVALISELEGTYAISFDDDIELDFLKDVRSLAEYVYQKTAPFDS
jgi:acyl carrier protein